MFENVATMPPDPRFGTGSELSPMEHEAEVSDDSEGVIFTATKSQSLKRKRLALSPKSCETRGGLGDGDVKRIRVTQAVKLSLHNEGYPHTAGNRRIIAYAPRIAQTVATLDDMLAQPKSFTRTPAFGTPPRVAIKSKTAQRVRARRTLEQNVAMPELRRPRDVSVLEPRSERSQANRTLQLRAEARSRPPRSTKTELEAIPSSPPVSPEHLSTEMQSTLLKLNASDNLSRQGEIDDHPASSSTPPCSSPSAPVAPPSRKQSNPTRSPGVSTATLQEMLPRRRRAPTVDEFDLPCSSGEDQSRVGDADEDELYTVKSTRPRLQTMRQGSSKPTRAYASARANQARKKATIQENLRKIRSPLAEKHSNVPRKRYDFTTKSGKKGTRTHRQQNSEKENAIVEEMAGSELAQLSSELPTSPRLQDPSRELKAISKKFEKVDEWAMEFEEATAHNSSIDFR